MFEVGSAIARIKADVSGFKSGVAQVQGDTKKMKTGFSDLGAGAIKMAGIFGIALGAAGVVGFLKSSVDAFKENERVMAQTEAVIKSTGGAAGFSAEQISKMAKEIQRTTSISDEAAQTGMNMLLTFTNISHDIFPATTQAVLDMATAMNGGLTPSAEQLAQTAIQVGKAIQDPILGVTALRRVGVNFNSTQQEMIKNLVNTGKTMQAQKYILHELATEFGGSAAAQARTFQGRMEQLKNVLDDVKETIGGVVTAGLGFLMDSLGDVGAASDGMASRMIQAQAIAITLAAGLVILAQVAVMVAKTIMAVFQLSLTGIRSAVVGGFTGMQNTVSKAQNSIQNLVTDSYRKQTNTVKSNLGQQGAAQNAAAKKTAKQLADETKNFENEMKKRKASFEQSLADLIWAHQDKVKTLERQISDENRDFSETLSDRKQSFTDTMIDLKQTHQEKVDEIVKQIAEETAKGVDADQEQIANLQVRLDAENTAYDAQVAKDTAREAEEIARLQRDHDQKVADTQKELNAEKAILDAHQGEVAGIKDKAREDDIARLIRQNAEENEEAKKQHEKKMQDIVEQNSAEGAAGGAAFNDALSPYLEQLKADTDKATKEAAKNMAINTGKGGKDAGQSLISNFVNAIIDKAQDAINFLKKYGAFNSPLFSNLVGIGGLPRFATGIQNFQGGSAMVGEMGPEIVNLPKGSSVIPNNKIGGNNFYLNIDLSGAIVADDMGAQRISEKIGDSIIKKLNTNVRF